MKHYRIYFIALVILISLMPVVALASGAFWQGEVRVNNNGTSTANNVTATVNISSQGLIDNGYATANLSDVAIEYSGTNAFFMPGVGSNPWVVFVDSIGAGLNTVYDLFTGGATGGKSRYFPGAGGMTSANFSIGNNFTIEQKGWIDTAAGYNKNLIKKNGAFVSRVSAEEEITSGIIATENYELTYTADGNFHDVDVSAYVPSGTTGVILELHSNTGTAYSVSLRKKGSTDDRYYKVTHQWAMIGVNTSRIFEIKSSNANMDIYIRGYTDNSWTFPDNATNISLTPVGGWTTIDLTASAPSSIGVVINAFDSSSAGLYNTGLRKKGSTDARTNPVAIGHQMWSVVGVDGSQDIEGYIENIALDFYLVGYCTAGSTFATNAANKSIGVTGTWTDVDCTAEAPNGSFLFFEVVTSDATYDYGWRTKSSAETLYQEMDSRHGWSVVEVDSSDVIVEHEIANVGFDAFLIGYATSGIYHPQEQFPYTASVTATGISSGEHTVKTEANGLFFGIGVDNTPSTSWPETSGLIFNAPMWHDESDADPFTTKDSTEYSCDVDDAVWSSSSGYTFNGTDGYITFTSDAAIENLAEWTIIGWIYPESTGEGGFGRVFITADESWRLIIASASELQADRAYTGQTSSTKTTGNPLTLNAWNHFAAWLDSSDNKTHIAVNNVEASYSVQDAGLGALASDTSDWYIGNDSGESRTWDGSIAELRVYNRVFSPTERTADYNGTKFKFNGTGGYFPYQLVGSGVPDNANDWNFLRNYSMPYMEYTSFEIDGSPFAYWEWQYSSTFTDTVSSLVATPTFRTTPSDDITASLISFDPVTESKMPTFTLAATFEILTGTPTMPSGMFEGGDYGYLPSAPINEILDEASVPRAAWWYPFLFLGICVIGFIVYGATTMIRGPTGQLHEGQIDGSLLLMFIVIEAALVALGKMGPIPLWPAYLFPIPGIALILSRKHYAWG